MSHSSEQTKLNLLIRGFQVSRMLRLVADFSIADKLSPGDHCAVTDLAIAANVQATPLLRVLRALATFGVFRVDADGRVAHTSLSLLLRADAPTSLRPAALALTARGSWMAWNELDAAMHGDVPHQRAWNTSRFEYLREHPDEGRNFDLLMSRDPSDRHGAVAAAYDFSGVATIVDIGGGNGALLQKILARHAGPTGVVFDRRDVLDAISPDAFASGRLTAVAGDFFERVPVGSDLNLLVRVMHDWPDEDCVRILRNCRLAMRSDARLMIVEHILQADPANAEAMDYLSDMQMMAMFGRARERTEAEFAELLSAAGFRLSRVIKTASPVSIVEAIIDPRHPTEGAK